MGVEQLKEELFKLIKNCDILSDDASGKIWSLGPKQHGPNMLLNLTDYKSKEIWPGSQLARDGSDKRSELESSLIQGFQLATASGPLCEEPMMGLAFVVDNWVVLEDSEAEDWPSAGGLRARCVVCQTGRVNRVALPCRHASTCHGCFDRLQSRCPMCRGLISSYFLLFPDPVSSPAPDSDDAPSSEAPRTWRSMWREFNVRLNTAMGLREN